MSFNGEHVPWSRVLAWALTVVSIPAAGYTANKIINQVEGVSKVVYQVQLKQATIEGNVSRLESQFIDYKNNSSERRSERTDDLKDIRSDVREIKDDLSRLAISVERLKR